MKRKITITMKSSRRLTTFCLTGALALGASGGALAAGNDAALQALFAQANYWHEKSHDELAMESLQKVLSVDANNTQALYLMALWSQQGGDMQAAAQWRARLAKAAPDSPGLQDLDNAKKMSQVPQGQLSLARQQARGGNIPGALATWRSMFNGNTPPAGLAAEYYLTMASDKSLYPQAISELRQYVAQHPQENAPRVALGKALTWREDTRREGISMLESMASGSKDADSGLRQALLWLGPQEGDQAFYDTWMQRHPQDSEVQNYFRERRSGQARGQGYANLNSGNTAAAKQQFEQVLQTNPQDADALAGMGYIAQRNGDFQAASQYLSRAADLGGDASQTRRQQAADALGIALGQIAKSIIFRRKSDDAAVLVVTSGDRRVDEKKVEAHVGKVGRADADFVKSRTGFSIGGVSPVAHATPPVTLIDQDLLRFDVVWAAAGHPNGVFPLHPSDLQRLTGAPVVDVVQASAPQASGAGAA